MASSPFRVFRKHQKVIFAALTILCMVTFVMCSGLSAGENFLSTLGVAFGVRHRPDIVATLYGKDVSAQEIQELRAQRRLAEAYIRAITQVDREQVLNAVMNASKKWDEPQQRVVQQVLMYRYLSMQSPQFRAQYFQALQQLQGLHFQFEVAKKTAEAGLTQDLLRALEREIMLMIRPRNEFYFGGTTSLEDALDFMIWRHEADRRGIQLTHQDINDLVLRETDNRGIPRADQKNIEESLRRFRNFTPDSFRTALADEFRVRIAKTALMGDDRSDPTSAVTWATPYEFWQFYKENRTENEIAALPIPVRNKDFLAQVGQPSEKDLKELFEKYKDVEYQEGSPDPGFKVPPRIEVEWVSAKADSDLYRKEAARVASLTQVGFQVLAGGRQTMSGSVAVDAITVALPIVFDFPLINQYQIEQYRFRNPSWTEEWSKFFNPQLHESSIRRANNVAATIGQALGSAATQAPVLSSGLTYLGSAALHESRDRGSIGTTMIATTAALAPTGPAPLISAALVDDASPHPQFVPLSEVKDQLEEKVQQDMAKKLAQAEFADLEKELRALTAQIRDKSLMSEVLNRPEAIAAMVGQAFGSAATGAPAALGVQIALSSPVTNSYLKAFQDALVTTLAGPSPYPLLVSSLTPLEKIRKAIDQAVARHGFEHGVTRKPEDRQTIAGDEGLKPFKDAFLSYRRFGEPKPKEFSDQFNQLFQNPNSYTPQQWPLGSDSDQSFAFWKTNDKAAYVPTFAEVQDKVKDWWQLDKARALAEKEAEELKAKAQGQPDAERWLKDGTKHSEPMFTLDEVAALVKGRTPFAGGSFSPGYQRYTIPPEKIEYPGAGLEKDLLDLKDVGQVIVRPNRPKTTYYVLALAKRTKPSEFAFSREYGSASDSLLRNLDQEKNYDSEYRKGIIQQLRDEARLTINDKNREQVDEKSRSDES
jgi:hypothetical protein